MLVVSCLLAHMDPLGSRNNSTIESVLEPFLTCGGLIVAACGKVIDSAKLQALTSLVGQERIHGALREPKRLTHYLQRFEEAQQRRERPLSALDVNRILICLITIARANGRLDDAELKVLFHIANLFGVTPGYVHWLLQGQQAGPPKF